jgi:hypothetical protein
MKKIASWILCSAILCSISLWASQNPLIVPDGTGAQVRAGFNNAIDSLNTLESGPSAPTVTEPYMLWANTTYNLLEQMNSTNSAWVVLGTLGVPNLGLQPAITPGTTSQYWRGDETWQTLPPSIPYPGAGVPLSTGSAWGTSYTVGTGPNDLVQLNSSGQLPAVSGANLTNLPSTGITTQNVVTSSRSLGAVYQNTTGKTLFVTVSVNCTNNTVNVLTGSSSPPAKVVASCGPSSQYGTISFMVLNGDYYEVTAAYALICWTEWY